MAWRGAWGWGAGDCDSECDSECGLGGGAPVVALAGVVPRSELAVLGILEIDIA